MLRISALLHPLGLQPLAVGYSITSIFKLKSKSVDTTPTGLEVG